MTVLKLQISCLRSFYKQSRRQVSHLETIFVMDIADKDGIQHRKNSCKSKRKKQPNEKKQQRI